MSHEDRREALRLPTLEERIQRDLTTTSIFLDGHHEVNICQFIVNTVPDTWKLNKDVEKTGQFTSLYDTYIRGKTS